MDRLGRKCRHTDRDILGSLGSAVANPLAPMRDDCLAGLDLNDTGFVFYPHLALEDHSVLIEVRPLAGFGPTRRTAHVSDARLGVARIYAPNVFVDNLVSRDGNVSRCRDQLRHSLIS